MHMHEPDLGWFGHMSVTLVSEAIFLKDYGEVILWDDARSLRLPHVLTYVLTNQSHVAGFISSYHKIRCLFRLALPS
jgi:hypothetical protein